MISWMIYATVDEIAYSCTAQQAPRFQELSCCLGQKRPGNAVGLCCLHSIWRVPRACNDCMDAACARLPTSLCVSAERALRGLRRSITPICSPLSLMHHPRGLLLSCPFGRAPAVCMAGQPPDAHEQAYERCRQPHGMLAVQARQWRG